MSVLYWLEAIRSPALDAVMQFFTLFGEETVFIVLALAVFWCVDKREGYYLLFVGFIGTILNQFLKLLFRVPRPWVKDPDFRIVESARAGAGGYSFPSGHTQSAVGTLGGIARWHKRGWLRAVCVALALLCAVSRMYLGVHTPQDVAVSLVLGTALVLALYPLLRRAEDSPRRMYVLLGAMVCFALVFVLYANLAAFPADIDAENLHEGRKNGWSLLGALLGFCIAYPLERRYIRFSERAVWWVQALKLVIGLLGLLAVKEGLKLLFAAAGMDWLWLNALRYGAVVLFAAALWPLSFPRLCALADRRKP